MQRKKYTQVIEDHLADVSIFKKSNFEKAKAIREKKQWNKKLIAEFGNKKVGNKQFISILKLTF